MWEPGGRQSSDAQVLHEMNRGAAPSSRVSYAALLVASRLFFKAKQFSSKAKRHKSCPSQADLSGALINKHRQRTATLLHATGMHTRPPTQPTTRPVYSLPGAMGARHIPDVTPMINVSYVENIEFFIFIFCTSLKYRVSKFEYAAGESTPKKLMLRIQRFFFFIRVSMHFSREFVAVRVAYI